MTQLPMLTTNGAAPAERGRCHVHFGDWREQEPDWPRPFVYVSDVPYGQRYKSGTSLPWDKSKDSRPDERTIARSIVGDDDTRERDAAMAIAGWQAAAIFGPKIEKLLGSLPPWGEPKAVLVWDKQDIGPPSTFPWRRNTETIAVYGRGWEGPLSSSVLRGSVLTFSRASAANGRQHPHEKPLSVVTELCSKAPPGLPIIDPFMGSGTTAVACALLGREFYGAEIDPQYFDVIRGRLAAVGVTIPPPPRET